MAIACSSAILPGLTKTPQHIVLSNCPTIHKEVHALTPPGVTRGATLGIHGFKPDLGTLLHDAWYDAVKHGHSGLHSGPQ